MTELTVLAVNSGSSSLKFGMYGVEGKDVYAMCSGETAEVGSGHRSLIVRGPNNEKLAEEMCATANLDEALHAVMRVLDRQRFEAPAGVAHRVVHGGPNLLEHQEITPGLLRELEAAEIFAPLHVPQALILIRQSQKLFPDARQFVCFDTAFHRTLPEEAKRFALPGRFRNAGVRRYGFHGISCEAILHSLGDAVPPRMIVAHLGNGASVTAIENGRSVDTTMGLTPTGGIVMGTRPGDLDPGVVLHLMRTTNSDVNAIENILDKQSGLLGISGRTSDMRELQEADDEAAQLAIKIFCRTAIKAIGGFIAILGGLDLLVFTGGIGEHDAEVRKRICAGLEAFGVTVDARKNSENSQVISANQSRVRVMVLQTLEEAQMARNVIRLMRRNC